jgi:hypothetical protein
MVALITSTIDLIDDGTTRINKKWGEKVSVYYIY